MVNFSQATAAFQIQTPLGPDAFVLLSFRGTENLSGLFEFILELGANKATRVDISSLIGEFASVALFWDGRVQRHIHGQICELAAQGSDGHLNRYQMVLRPRLWQLSLVKQSRIFQNQDACQILDTVLKPVSGGDQSVFLPPPTRVYSTQYRETDLAFFNRLCFEQGIAHYWVHTGLDHRLILSNSTVIAPSSGDCHFNQSGGGSGDTASIKAWETRQTMVNPRVSMRDSHFQLFNYPLTSEGTAKLSVTAGTVPFTISSSTVAWQENAFTNSRYFDSISPSGETENSAISVAFDQLPRRAYGLSTAAACKAVIAKGHGNCMNLVAGHQFKLHDHPDADGLWLVTSLEHHGKQEGFFWRGEQPNVTYSNNFEAVPAVYNQKPWPPVPKPSVGSIETAIVTGPPGQEANLDQFGRVQVRFWWDASENQSATSCWIRVAQCWAGQGYGAFFWPRCGHEVVVAFEHGDPDRPIIVGSLYNSVNVVPLPMPKNSFLSGIKTKTENGDVAKNFHTAILSDMMDSAVIYVHAETHMITNQEKNQVTQSQSRSITLEG